MLVSLTGCSKGGSGTHLLVAHSHNENHPVHVALTYMKDEMEKNTGYTFSIYPNGQLGGNSDMIQMVKAGVLDVAKVSASSLEQFNPAYSIFSLPYVFQSTEHYFKVMEESRAVQEIFKSTYDQGFFAVGWYDSGARSVYTTKEGPVESPADLKGLKIRTQDSPTSIEMIRNMGGAATPMSSGEVYTSLQQGIIDGAENNETVLVDDGHGEVASPIPTPSISTRRISSSSPLKPGNLCQSRTRRRCSEPWMRVSGNMRRNGRKLWSAISRGQRNSGSNFMKSIRRRLSRR